MASRRGETQSFCSPSTFSPPPRLLSTDRPAFLCFQTETAATRIAALLAKRREQEPATAVRVGIKARGCNGLSYTMSYATEPKKLEETVENHGAPRTQAPACSHSCPSPPLPTHACGVSTRRVPRSTFISSHLSSTRRDCLRGTACHHAYHRHDNGFCRRRSHFRVCLPQSECRGLMRLWRVIHHKITNARQ